MLENLDFSMQENVSSIFKYKTDSNFNTVLEDNFEKINWMYFNASKYLSNKD